MISNNLNKTEKYNLYNYAQGYFYTLLQAKRDTAVIDSISVMWYNIPDLNLQKCDESGVRHKLLGNVTAEKRMLVVGKCAWSCY